MSHYQPRWRLTAPQRATAVASWRSCTAHYEDGQRRIREQFREDETSPGAITARVNGLRSRHRLSLTLTRAGRPGALRLLDHSDRAQLEVLQEFGTCVRCVNVLHDWRDAMDGCAVSRNNLPKPFREIARTMTEAAGRHGRVHSLCTTIDSVVTYGQPTSTRRNHFLNSCHRRGKMSYHSEGPIFTGQITATRAPDILSADEWVRTVMMRGISNVYSWIDPAMHQDLRVNIAGRDCEDVSRFWVPVEILAVDPLWPVENEIRAYAAFGGRGYYDTPEALLGIIRQGGHGNPNVAWFTPDEPYTGVVYPPFHADEPKESRVLFR